MTQIHLHLHLCMHVHTHVHTHTNGAPPGAVPCRRETPAGGSAIIALEESPAVFPERSSCQLTKTGFQKPLNGHMSTPITATAG